ncbi:MAG: anthranilate phosphoribosyltransferase [Candidatus Omnitrophica bacterium]|nr:anthranilate phosphoribosyltransferase [Candidatus Omnitrophota bacterium]
MIKESISKIASGESLVKKEMEEVFSEIMQGLASPAQIGAFITALHIKGETIEEITAAATIMRKFSTKVNTQHRPLLDTCGTGGSKLHTFNVSTLSAFIASGAGVYVAKHGNRASSGKCGSADLLEKLGVNIEAEIPVVEKCLNEIGVCFMFAPKFHPAMKHAIGPRREIGIRTIFNILGPLTNPASAAHQLLGVFSEKLVEPLVSVLKNLGLKHALVAHGQDGMDEISTTSETIIAELVNGQMKKYIVAPEQFGMKRTDIKSLQIDDSTAAAKIAQDILDNKDKGPIYEFTLLNAAFAIYAADAAASPGAGLDIAKESLESGKAREKLESLKKITNAVNT